MLKYLLLPVLVTLGLACGPVDEGAEANKRFVEAVALLEAAESEPYAPTKLALLEQAETTLQTIVTRYPSTDLAVKLTSGQQIGNVSLATVATAVEAARGPACQVAPTAACVIAQAVALAQTLDGWGRSQALRNVIRALAGIAPVQTQTGNRAGAQATLAQALVLAQTLTDEEGRDAALANIAAQAGDYVEARAIIARVLARTQTLDAKNQGALFAFIARTQAQIGDRAEAQATLAQAVAFVQTLTDEKERDLTLALLLAVLIEGGDTVQALALVPMVTDEKMRATLLARIATTQVHAGNRTEAQETASQALALARTLTDGKERIYTLAHIAPALAQAGDHAEARTTVAQVLAFTPTARIQIGDQTIEVEGIPEGMSQDAIIAYVRKNHPDVLPASSKPPSSSQSDTPAFQPTFSWLPTPREGSRGVELTFIAQAQAYMGDGVQALALAQTLDDKRQRAEALADVALALARVAASDAQGTAFWNWVNSFW